MWGLSPRQLHDAKWIGHGVQCVRLGEDASPDAIDRTADLYLLLEPDQCVIFDLSSMIERLVWHGAVVTRIRILDPAPATYDERIISDERGHVQRIERCYGANKVPHACSRRVFITSRPALAERWARASTPRKAWLSVRKALGGRAVRCGRVDRIRIHGQSIALRAPQDEARLLTALVESWSNPGRIVEGVVELTEDTGVWNLARDRGTGGGEPYGLIGPIWLGCGRASAKGECIVGPAWRADDPEALRAARVLDGRPPAKVRTIPEVELDERSLSRRRVRPLNRRAAGFYPAVKRAIDATVSAAALLAFSPLMLIIALVVFATDGRPILFRHKRQTVGGRPFDCLKFRTMYSDAEALLTAEALNRMNLCDGAQVYIPNDPRVTPIGRMLRATHLDELPQLWNVLVGEMSLVGPRPSPDRENRFCPAWRELRLSVRPGITGLWQTRRTRSPGRDFQEWVRYDIEYVRNAGLALDLRILVETARLFVFGRNLGAGEDHET